MRSQAIFRPDCAIGPAEQSNIVSSLLDLTIVYGDDMATLNRLRTKESGKLKTNKQNVLPLLDGCVEEPCYTLGDVRLVQTPLLAQQHSLLLRMHNKCAEGFAKLKYDDEKAFQEARSLLIALFHQLIYNEWLPMLLGNEQPNRP